MGRQDCRQTGDSEVRRSPTRQESAKRYFITTSSFSKDALEYANSVETKVILIDGSRLVELMFDYGVGVSTVNNYAVKGIDSDFFEDEVGFDVAPDAATK